MYLLFQNIRMCNISSKVSKLTLIYPDSASFKVECVLWVQLIFLPTWQSHSINLFILTSIMFKCTHIISSIAAQRLLITAFLNLTIDLVQYHAFSNVKSSICSQRTESNPNGWTRSDYHQFDGMNVYLDKLFLC